MSNGISRRSALKSAGVIGATTLAGCVGGIGGGGSGGPIKIGSVLPLSGPLALVGQEDQRGTKVAGEHLGSEVLGEDLEIVYRDSETNPQTALQATRELVEQEDVDALAGVASSASGIGVIPYLKNEAQVPHTFAQVGTPTAREQDQYCTKYAFYPWASMRQQALPHVEFIANELSNHVDADTSKLHFIGLDYEAGQTGRDMVSELFGEVGGEVVGATMVPQGETDLAPYLTEVENSEADVVSGFMPGQAAVQIINQANEFGLKEEKTMCLLGDTSSPLPLASTGDAATGWYGVHWYDEDRDAEMNNTFKDIYTSNWDDLPPNDIAVSGFNTVYSLAQGMEEAGSRNPDDVIEAMAGMTYDSPMGELTYRAEDHQTMLNCIGYEVTSGGNREVLTRYPDVIGEAFCQV